MKKMFLITLLQKNIVFPFVLLFAATFSVYGTVQEKEGKESYKLDNPVTVSYLKRNLSKQLPRLVLNYEIEKNLKKKKPIR